MAETFITLEEAASFEGLTYKGMASRLQRNPESYKTKTVKSEDGGKDRVLVAVSSLSKKARRAFKEARQIDSISGSDIVVDERTSQEVPWYVDIDFDWYREKFSKQYYKAVELAKHIQEFLDYNEGDRTAYAEEFAGKLSISQRTLYRHAKNYLEAGAWAMKLSKENGKNYDFLKVLSLCRKPKEQYTFPSISEPVRAFIQNIWFDKDFAANLGTIEMLYSKLEQVAKEKQWEYPSYQTVARYINYLMEVKRLKNAHFLAAKGVKEYKNKVMVKATRDTSSLPVMGLVQGDVHTFDCWVKYTHPNGKVTAIRPNMLAWVDVRSRAIVSSVMALHINADITKQSILKMIYNKINGRPCGVPQWINIDNGKEFTAETLTGRKRHQRVSFDSETTGFFRSVGIQDDIRSLPYQPWSKAYIERFFGTVESGFTRWMASYTGTLTGSRTAAKVKRDVPAMLERDELLSLEEFYELWLKYLQEYHQREHRGLKSMKEKWLKPGELFANAEERYYKPAPPKSYATMLMMKADRVHVYRTGIHRFGNIYHAEELYDYHNEKVDIRWDPADITRLYVYDAKDGRKICEAVSQELLLFAPKVPQKALEEHLRAQRDQLKRDRERLDEMTTPLEELIDQHVNGPSDVVGGFIVKNEGKKSNDKVVALPVDKQFAQELKGKKKQAKHQDNDFFIKKAQDALARLRQMG